MEPRAIRLFMWSYQPHFRDSVQRYMTDVLTELGAPDARPECFLVGVRIRGREVRNEVCIEPEDGDWPLNLFSSVLDDVEKAIADGPIEVITNVDEQELREWREEKRSTVARSAASSWRFYGSMIWSMECGLSWEARGTSVSTTSFP